MLCGFSSTGFMCKDGGARAARACNAWARPISPPSAVTAALFDMFCGLNGRTLSPRKVKARARPATISDLPTSEPVPWNISARAGIALELDPGLRLHTGGKMMLHQRHLGDEIGSRGQFRLGIAARDHDMQIRPPRGKRRDDGVEIEIVVAQCDVELVENQHGDVRIGHEALRRGPGPLGGRDIAGA